MTWLQRDPGGAQYEAIRARVEAAVERGLPMYLQAAARGIGVPRMRADLNLIDPRRLALNPPVPRRDLPGGGRRFVQTAEGYVATYVAGRAVQREGTITTERPGRLVRLGRRA
jgi:N-acyl-D-aspartate/D-glutamate deacylase